MSAQLKLLSWLIDNPGWQYGKHAADGSKTSDTLVYLRMEDLEQLGFVERRQEPAPTPGMPARTQFRSVLRKNAPSAFPSQPPTPIFAILEEHEDPFENRGNDKLIVGYVTDEQAAKKLQVPRRYVEHPEPGELRGRWYVALQPFDPDNWKRQW